MARQFGRLVADRNGVPGELTLAPDAAALADRLGRGEAQLAVFHGFEFAWARRRHPGLRALAVAVTRQRRPTALVVARADAGLDGFAALKGKTLAVPEGTKEYCRLYLERQAPRDRAPDAPGRVTHPASIEDALEDVIDHQADAAVVDAASLEAFRSLKPARAARLRVAASSPQFPAAVVAYCEGSLDDATLTHLKRGLLNAGQTPQGTRVLTLWQLEAFEAPPADYEQQLAEVLREYPPPEAARSK
jgi:ABC-type phosphate/phosphonate transport system substrate-binding protein